MMGGVLSNAKNQAHYATPLREGKAGNPIPSGARNDMFNLVVYSDER
jgi:hypothetical protein